MGEGEIKTMVVLISPFFPSPIHSPSALGDRTSNPGLGKGDGVPFA